jgi:DNA repair protein RadA/Sms
VGGVKISEPAVDLAVLLSIVSSLKNKALSNQLIVFGEVGLAGEVRPVQRGKERLKEAVKLGFKFAIIPKANAPKQEIKGLQVFAVDWLDQALQHASQLS